MDDQLWEKTERVEEIFSGRIIRVHVDDVRLSNGGASKREVVEHPGGVTAVILTPDNQVILVRQFRYPYQQVLLELPAGKLEPGEDPLEAMKREQREETGTSSTEYISLGNLYPTPGYCGEIIRMWACRTTDAPGELDLDEDEFVEPVLVPLDQAVEMVLKNEIPDGKTQVGILKAAKLVELKKL